MKAHGKDRGVITMAVLAPVVAAIIGGGAAILAAVQIVNLAPSNADPGPSATQLSGDIQYGDR
jgi:hypothetical protein